MISRPQHFEISRHRLAGKIVETEAYLGIKDRACHTFGDRRTGRTLPMYGAGGQAYIYLIYGMYDCFNVVTEKEGIPEAVLIRAIEPLEGLSEMKKRRGTDQERQLCSGPGKLCRAIEITRELNSHRLNELPLIVAQGDVAIKRSQIIATTRIGVAYAGVDAQKKWRYYLKNNPYVSKK